MARVPKGEMSEKDVQRVLAKHIRALMKLPNVNGVGIREEPLPNGEVRLFIQVDVIKKLTRAQLKAADVIPKNLDGIKVRVREVDDLKLE
jgi:hypothetical protein